MQLPCARPATVVLVALSKRYRTGLYVFSCRYEIYCMGVSYRSTSSPVLSPFHSMTSHCQFRIGVLRICESMSMPSRTMIKQTVMFAMPLQSVESWLALAPLQHGNSGSMYYYGSTSAGASQDGIGIRSWDDKRVQGRKCQETKQNKMPLAYIAKQRMTDAIKAGRAKVLYQ